MRLSGPWYIVYHPIAMFTPPGGCPLDQGRDYTERLGAAPGILARMSWETGNWTDISGVRARGILRAAASCDSPRPTGRRCPSLAS